MLDAANPSDVSGFVTGTIIALALFFAIAAGLMLMNPTIQGPRHSDTPWVPPAEDSEYELSDGQKVRVQKVEPNGESGWYIRFAYPQGYSMTHRFDIHGNVTYWNIEND